MTGDDEPPSALYEASHEIYRNLDDEHGMAITEHRIGVNRYRVGERERARAVLEESLRRSNAGGFRVNGMMVRGSLAWFDYQEGLVEQAFDATKQTLTAAQEIGYRWWESNLRNTLAVLALELVVSTGRGACAAELSLGLVMSDRRHALQGLGYLAQFAAMRADRERAGCLWGALEAEELSRRGRSLRPRMRGWEEERASFEAVVLGDADDGFERARAEGRRMTLEDAVVYALGSDERRRDA